MAQGRRGLVLAKRRWEDADRLAQLAGEVLPTQTRVARGRAGGGLPHHRQRGCGRMKRKKPEPAFCWVYTVRTGESLQSIAGSFLGNWKRCGEIKRLNSLKGELIKPGQVLRLPR